MSNTQTASPMNILILDTMKELKASMVRVADRIDDLNSRVSHVEGADLKTALESIDSRLKALEEKVSRLDKNQAVIYGIVAFVGVVAGFFGTFVNGFFRVG